ncbi:uncharacterized protein EV154DRAFT_487715 [Mucor mucedo]|uniref:uncharacterized protein n=1 Tax=Mucor mucedo TaxID=29922 RepID=UPI002220C3C9|nr:uncharacterized protein EV154DRAFT_487715 [Mucor mucedo]KAI7871126.1 hypothetical protein EV154DRAFT_487715 [Mucor mucedo]
MSDCVVSYLLYGKYGVNSVAVYPICNDEISFIMLKLFPLFISTGCWHKITYHTDCYFVKTDYIIFVRFLAIFGKNRRCSQRLVSNIFRTGFLHVGNRISKR